MNTNSAITEEECVFIFTRRLERGRRGERVKSHRSIACGRTYFEIRACRVKRRECFVSFRRDARKDAALAAKVTDELAERFQKIDERATAEVRA